MKPRTRAHRFTERRIELQRNQLVTSSEFDSIDHNMSSYLQHGYTDALYVARKPPASGPNPLLGRGPMQHTNSFTSYILIPS